MRTSSAGGNFFLLETLVQHIATSLTILGILLHALLGCCAPHSHGGCGQTVCSHAVPQKNSAGHGHCHGHTHTHFTPSHDQTGNHDHPPATPEQHPGCDHADCFFVDGSSAAQKITVPTPSWLLIAGIEYIALQAPARVTAQAAPLFEPPPLAQAARIARCVWLI